MTILLLVGLILSPFRHGQCHADSLCPTLGVFEQVSLLCWRFAVPGLLISSPMSLDPSCRRLHPTVQKA